MNRKKGLLLLTAALIVFSGLFSQTPDWQWANLAGGTGADLGYAISLDGSGNTYITGYFNGTVTFGTTSLISNGSDDIFIAKADTQGNWLWAKSAGGTGSDQGWDIITDASGNSFVTGYFTDSVTFGSTTLSSNSTGLTDVFVAKLDSNGNCLWALDSSGSGSADGGSITLGINGNIMLTGSFNGMISLGSSWLLSYPAGVDIFVAKIDPNGAWFWGTQAGGMDYDYSNDISTDINGNSYITGWYGDSAMFGSTTLYGGGGIGYYSIFTAKIDANGYWVWANSVLSSLGADCGYGIVTDASGNCYTIGQFYSNVVFGSIFLSTSNYGEIYVAKMDTNGNWLWAVQAGGASTDAGFGIALDSSGHIYTTGYFKSTANFGSFSLTTSGTNDIFIAKLDNNGNWLWANRAGGTAIDKGWGIATDNDSNCYLSGVFAGNASFGTTTLTGSGGNDIFIAKYGQGGNAESPQNLAVSFDGGYPSLAWDAYPGATGYYIYRSTDPYLSDWGYPAGYITGTSWTDFFYPDSLNAFYRVTAELNTP
jgi:hypothetical protein